MFHHMKHWLALALGGNVMPKLLSTGPVKSGNYNIPYTELFSFMWRAGLKRDLNSVRVTCFNSREDLCIERNNAIN